MPEISTDESAPEHRVGELVSGRWRIDRLLGVGSVASAYAAIDTSTGARVAVRVLHPELLSDPTLRARFLREVRLAGSIDHAAIVRVHADGTTKDGAPFLVIEFLDGETIDRRMRRKGGRLPVREALFIADAALDALAEAHAMGVVHRDVRVENLFLTSDHAVKVLDFGIARVRYAAAERVSAELSRADGAASALDEASVEDDLWGVGAALFTMITGEPVLEGQLRHELARAPTPVTPPSLALKSPGTPGVVSTFVDRALSLAPGAGWTDAREMQRSLREAIEIVKSRPSHNPHVVSPFSAPLRAVPRRPISAEAPSPEELESVKIPKASSVPNEMRLVHEASTMVSASSGTIPMKWAVIVVVGAIVLGGAAAVLLGGR